MSVTKPKNTHTNINTNLHKYIILLSLFYIPPIIIVNTVAGISLGVMSIVVTNAVRSANTE